jgi:Glycosyl hydrolases family 35
MKFFHVLRLYVFILSLPFVSCYNVPKGSPGFYHGNSTAAVTFDNHSLFLDGKRLFVFSGEVHPWRVPTGVPGWRDILQKMKVLVVSSGCTG